MPRLTNRLKLKRRIRAGFTLAELLATMTLLGLIGTVVAKIMMGQQRFYHRQNEQLGVRRELRTAMSIVPADLRGVSSSGGDLTAFSANSVTFRNVLGTSIVCAKPLATVIELPPRNMARNTLTSWYTPPRTGDSVFVFDEGPLRGAEDDTWAAAVIQSSSENAAFCPLSVYTDATLDATKGRYRFIISPALSANVKIGAAVRFVRSTRYTLSPEASGKYYLARAEYDGGWGAPTPVSGPYDAPGASGGGGVQFAFFDSTGTAVTNMADSRRVARIDLIIRATGASTSGDLGGGTAVKDSLAFRIALRNRQ